MLLWTLRLQFWQPPTKFMAGNPEKRRWIAIFFVFFSERVLLSDCSSGHALNNFFGFAPKKAKIHTSSPKSFIQSSGFLRKVIFANCFSGSNECWVQKTDKKVDRKFEIFIPVAFYKFAFKQLFPLIAPLEL